jgi:hypothetical protein
LPRFGTWHDATGCGGAPFSDGANSSVYWRLPQFAWAKNRSSLPCPVRERPNRCGNCVARRECNGNVVVIYDLGIVYSQYFN